MQGENLASLEVLGPIVRVRAPRAPLRVLGHQDQGCGFADVILLHMEMDFEGRITTEVLIICISKSIRNNKAKLLKRTVYL